MSSRPGTAPGVDTSGGFSYIELLFIIVVISILAALAVPFLQKARMSSNEGSALAGVRTIMQGQVAYENRYHNYGTLQELVDDQLIDGSLGSGSKSGYQFLMQIATQGRFEIVAIPQEAGVSGEKGFYGDETGVIRSSTDGSMPGPTSPPVTGS